MLGGSILVAPVVEQGMTQKLVYLPEGTWYDFWTKEKVQGGRYFIREAALDVCPIYVKAGSILPMYASRLTTMGEKDQELYLDVYPGEGVCEYVHYQDNGEDFQYLEGEYNLYRFQVKNGELDVQMIHQGYEKKYEKIEILK